MTRKRPRWEGTNDGTGMVKMFSGKELDLVGGSNAGQISDLSPSTGPKRLIPSHSPILPPVLCFTRVPILP
jgi:hypothetical protein